MSEIRSRKQYWERKILGWERSRYEGSSWLKPASWTLRRRMDLAVRVAREVLPRGGRLVELGCGTGFFAERMRGFFGSYSGFDIAEAAVAEARRRLEGTGSSVTCGDVSAVEIPPADLVVMLGLVDWLEPGEVEHLFRRIRSRFVLFSYTEEPTSFRWNPYSVYRSIYDARFGHGVYRARSYPPEVVRGWVEGFATIRREIGPSHFLDPGRLVLIENSAPSKK